MFEDYYGKHIIENFEEVGEKLLDSYGLSFDEVYDGEFSVILIERPYEEQGETWNVTRSLFVTFDDEEGIDSIDFDDRVWGEDALGDFNPDEVYEAEEIELSEKVAIELLNAITE